MVSRDGWQKTLPTILFLTSKKTTTGSLYLECSSQLWQGLWLASIWVVTCDTPPETFPMALWQPLVQGECVEQICRMTSLLCAFCHNLTLFIASSLLTMTCKLYSIWLWPINSLNIFQACGCISRHASVLWDIYWSMQYLLCSSFPFDRSYLSCSISEVLEINLCSLHSAFHWINYLLDGAPHSVFCYL